MLIKTELAKSKFNSLINWSIGMKRYNELAKSYH